MPDELMGYTDELGDLCVHVASQPGCHANVQMCCDCFSGRAAPEER